jgi:hypothetical protein
VYMELVKYKLYVSLKLIFFKHATTDSVQNTIYWQATVNALNLLKKIKLLNESTVS